MSSREAKSLQHSLSKEESGVFLRRVMGSSGGRKEHKKKDETRERDVAGSSKEKAGKKSKGKHKAKKSVEQLQAAKKTELRQALRVSAHEAGVRMGRTYRALAETSESSEEEFLDNACAAMSSDDQCDNCTDEESQEEGEEDSQQEAAAEGEDEDDDDDDDYDDDGTDDTTGSDIPPPAPRPKKRSASAKKGGRKKKFVDPESDNDPDPPSALQPDVPPDAHGWTRTLADVLVRPFRGKNPPGPTFRRSISPLAYFFQFFPLSLMVSIVNWTSMNLVEVGKKKTNIREIRAWFGLHFLMGLIKMTNYRAFWSTHSALRNPMISSTMSRTRFEDINTHLACSDPDKDPAFIANKARRDRYKKKHPLYPLKPLWNKVRRRCRSRYNALRELTIDEAMIKYRGYKANIRKVFMPLKPIRVGFKIFVLAESATGAILNFMEQPLKSTTKMISVATKVAKHHFGRHHHIFTDRLYTSVPLARSLLAHKTYLTGAIQTNRKGLPEDLKRRLRGMRKVPRGTNYSRQNGQMIVTMWKDSKAMATLSTAHQGWRDPDLHNVKRKVPDDSGHRKTKVVPAPPQVIDYMANMGGVDRGDQLRAYYTCSRKSQFWWKKVLYFLLDVSRVNAYVCYLRHRHLEVQASEGGSSDDDDATVGNKSTKLLSHRQFVLKLGEELVDGYAGGSASIQCKASSMVPRHNVKGHYSAKMPGLYPKRCQWCLRNNGVTKSGHIKTTRCGCAVCLVNLCPGPCFIKFHQAASNLGSETTDTTDTTTDITTEDSLTEDSEPPKKKKKSKKSKK